MMNAQKMKLPPPRAIPYDARAVRWLIRPLVGTRVTPNHLTTLRLLVGLTGVALIASDGYLDINFGMVLAAAVGTPLFALWVLPDYVKAPSAEHRNSQPSAGGKPRVGS